MIDISVIDPKKYKKVCYDSRAVESNSIFVCIKGEKSDGHDFIDKAISAGAKLIIVEKNSPKINIHDLEKKYQEQKIVFVEAVETRAALAEISSGFYGEPSKKLKIIGVTGTNGKTTVTHLIQNILNESHCALLGTLGLKEKADGSYREMSNTTPQSTEIQRVLHDLVEKGFSYLTMEVSSHALDQKRVGGIEFKGVVITNLTQDHLDYHVTMEKYFEAKAEIIKQCKEYIVLNADDEYYKRFLAKIEQKNSLPQQSNLAVITCGISNDADIRAGNMKFDDNGLSFEIEFSDKFINKVNKTNVHKIFKLKLNGLFNIYNSLAAIAVGLLEDKNLGEIKKILEATEPIAGRFEAIKNPGFPMCIVDYAHSPDGLKNILIGARELIKAKQQSSKVRVSKLICLFGCGGDRDITKRPKMGKIAYDLADFVYVTSDNPRTEDPDQIIADILAGIPNLDKAKVIPDRAQAIRQAIVDANEDDIVVIAGKGHENYQILNTGTIHFDDREQVREVLMSNV